MANGGAIELQIIEPIVIEIEAPSIPVIPTVSSPPIGIPSIIPPINVNYECPMSIYCGTDTPCAWSWTMPTLPVPTVPVFSFPPQFQIPSFGFRFELPPPIFINCPAFPEDEFAENQERNGEKEEVNDDGEVNMPTEESASIEANKELLKKIQ